MSCCQTNKSLKCSDSDGHGELIGVGTDGSTTQSTVETGSIANGILSELWSLAGTYKRDILLKEFASNNSDALFNSSGQIFFKDSGSLAILSVLDVEFALNYSIVIVVVDLRSLASIHETMIGNDSLGNTSVLLRLLLVKHNKKEIETG